MAFEGPMLAASVVRALAALPGAIRDVKALLSKPQADAEAAIDKLNELRDHVLVFCEVEASLREVKEIHDVLHKMDRDLEPVRSAYEKATAEGQFIPTQYDVKQVRQAWDAIKRHSLTQLFSKAQAIRIVEAEPLVLDVEDRFVSGPPWARKFVEFRLSIKAWFDDIDDAKRPDERVLSDHMSEFGNHVDRLMSEANRRIIDEATAFSKELHRLSGAMGSL